MAVRPNLGPPIEESVEGEIGGGEVRKKGLGWAFMLDVDVDAGEGLGAGRNHAFISNQQTINNLQLARSRRSIFSTAVGKLRLVHD